MPVTWLLGTSAAVNTQSTSAELLLGLRDQAEGLPPELGLFSQSAGGSGSPPRDRLACTRCLPLHSATVPVLDPRTCC